MLSSLSVLVLASTPAVAATSPNKAWTGYSASGSAAYNQTLSTHMFDDSVGAEMGLAVTVRDTSDRWTGAKIACLWSLHSRLMFVTPSSTRLGQICATIQTGTL